MWPHGGYTGGLCRRVHNANGLHSCLASFIIPKDVALLGFIRDSLLLFPVAYNMTGKRLDEDKHFTKSGHTLSSIRISGIFTTETHTSTPRQSG